MNRLKRFVRVALIVLCWTTAALSQASSSATSKPAANAWMFTPTPYLEWNKGVPPDVRAARDRYMDQVTPPSFDESPDTPRRLPINSPAFREFVTSSGCDGAATGPELTHAPDRAIVTAKFVSHRSVLSASGYSLYTEVRLSVEQVFEDQTGSQHMSPHSELTVILAGGAVTLPSGATLKYKTTPGEWALQPDHTYLFVLSYQREGDFYFDMDDWDISDGVVRPNDCRTEYWAASGRSSLNALPVQQLRPALYKMLEQNQP